MGDKRYRRHYDRLRAAPSPQQAMREMADEDVIQALAAASSHQDPFLANVLATEAMNRMRRASAILAHTTLGTISVDGDARVTFANLSFCELVAAPRSDVVGAALGAILQLRNAQDEAVTGTARDPFRVCLVTGEALGWDGVLIRLDGTRREVAMVVSPVLVEGEVTGAVGVVRDITGHPPRRQAAPRAAIEPAELGIGRLFDVSSDAIVVMDGRGRVRLWNPAASRIFGYTREEAFGMLVDQLVPPELRAAHQGGVARYHETGHGRLIDGGKPIEVPGLRKDGTRVWVELALSPLEHQGERFALAILRDITERLRLREETAAAHRQLREAYESLEAFTYVVSHDLKEPVRGVAAYLQELRENPDAEDRAALIARASDAHVSLQRLLEGLLEWSRSSLAPLDLRTIRLQEMLRDPGCAAQWQRLAEERHARIDVAADVPAVRGTDEILCRVFGNLITNAIRHNGRPDPRVRILSAPSDRPSYVRILVVDNGPGFPARLLAMPEPFGAKPGSLHSGLGLVIARRALARVDGALSFANTPEGGVARVDLPAG